VLAIEPAVDIYSWVVESSKLEIRPSSSSIGNCAIYISKFIQVEILMYTMVLSVIRTLSQHP
jgi:hypothetical protein